MFLLITIRTTHQCGQKEELAYSPSTITAIPKQTLLYEHKKVSWSIWNTSEFLGDGYGEGWGFQKAFIKLKPFWTVFHCWSSNCSTSSLHQHWLKWWYITYTNSLSLFFKFFFLQLQNHDREDEDVPSKWRTEAEMAAEASDLRDRLKDLWAVKE